MILRRELIVSCLKFFNTAQASRADKQDCSAFVDSRSSRTFCVGIRINVKGRDAASGKNTRRLKPNSRSKRETPSGYRFIRRAGVVELFEAEGVAAPCPTMPWPC